MRNLKELKTLLCDPLKFYYDTGHKISFPYAEDPLKERLIFPSYQIDFLKQSLYFQEIDTLFDALEPLANMGKASLMADLEEQKRLIDEQLRLHQLNKNSLFSIEVLDPIKEPFFHQKVYFYPKKTFSGAIRVVSEKGILMNLKRKKSLLEFKELLPPLLLLSTLDTSIPLKVLLFEGEEFCLTKSEAEEILACLTDLYPIALKRPLELPKNQSEGYGSYSSIAPFFEEVDSSTLTHLNTLIKELYDRF